MAKVPRTPQEPPAQWTPTRMLARLDGDRELAVQLVEIFIDEYPNMLQRLRDAVAAASADDVRRAAHALKGSISNFSDGGPTATAYELETMGRAGHVEGALPLLERLDRELVELTASLREFRSKRAEGG